MHKILPRTSRSVKRHRKDNQKVPRVRIYTEPHAGAVGYLVSTYPFCITLQTGGAVLLNPGEFEVIG